MPRFLVYACDKVVIVCVLTFNIGQYGSMKDLLIIIGL